MEIWQAIEKTELTESEIWKAKEEKYNRLQREKWLNDIKSLKEIIKHTPEQYYEAFCRDFIPADEQTDPVLVKKLCCYFACDARFETGPYSRAKGIWLCGWVGVGKSTLMEVFQRNQAFSYRLISVREVEAEFMKDGAEAIDKYSSNREIAINSNPYGHQEVGYCFDDLGTENAVTKHFGNAKNVMADILLNRYDKKIDPRATHVTTNISSWDEIERLYGTRLLDRIAENYNVITYDKDAKSRR